MQWLVGLSNKEVIMALWFIENWLDKKRNERDLQKQKDISQFQQDLDWKNRERFLDELRKTAVANKVPSDLIEGLARSTMFPTNTNQLVDIQKMLATRNLAGPNAAANMNADTSGALVQDQYNQGVLPLAKKSGFKGTMNKISMGASAAGEAIARMEQQQAAADEAKAVKQQKIDAELAAFRERQNQSDFNSNVLASMLPLASQTGVARAQEGLSKLELQDLANQNMFARERQWKDIGGPAAEANFNKRPSTITLGGEVRDFNSSTPTVIALQNQESDRAHEEALRMASEGKKEQAAQFALQQMNMYKDDPYLRAQWANTYVQILNGRGVSMLSTPNSVWGSEALTPKGGSGGWNIID